MLSTKTVLRKCRKEEKEERNRKHNASSVWHRKTEGGEKDMLLLVGKHYAVSCSWCRSLMISFGRFDLSHVLLSFMVWLPSHSRFCCHVINLEMSSVQFFVPDFIFLCSVETCLSSAQLHKQCKWNEIKTITFWCKKVMIIYHILWDIMHCTIKWW